MLVRGSRRARTGRRLWGVGCGGLPDTLGGTTGEGKPASEAGKRDEDRRDDTVAAVHAAGPQPGRKPRHTGGLTPWIALGIAALAAVAVARLTTGTGEIDGIETFTYIGGLHTEADVPYTENPGVGGPHHPTWQNCAVYDAEIREEHAVHSLEHGAVWITYRDDDLDAQEKLDLTTRYEGRSHVIVSPRNSQETPIVVSAWNRRLAVQRADDPRIGVFVAQYFQGPQAPESGAPCDGGTDATIDTTIDTTIEERAGENGEPAAP